jgi:hypothetical protein
MEWLAPIWIAVVVLAGISLLAYLKRIAAATERIAEALERSSSNASEDAPAKVDEHGTR